MFVFAHFWSAWSKLNTENLNVTTGLKISEDILTFILHIGRKNRFIFLHSYFMLFSHTWTKLKMSGKKQGKLDHFQLTGHTYENPDKTEKVRTNYAGLSWPFLIHRPDWKVPGQNQKCSKKLCRTKLTIFSSQTRRKNTRTKLKVSGQTVQDKIKIILFTDQT